MLGKRWDSHVISQTFGALYSVVENSKAQKLKRTIWNDNQYWILLLAGKSKENIRIPPSQKQLSHVW
jgi:hypothetical protein